MWTKYEVRARLFLGTLSRRARSPAGAVGGDQLLRISSPYVPRFQRELAFGVHHAHRGNRARATEADHPALLGEAGFSLTRVIPTAGRLSISNSRQVLESQIIAG
jgi:hypothetical protein